MFAADQQGRHSRSMPTQPGSWCLLWIRIARNDQTQVLRDTPTSVLADCQERQDVLHLEEIDLHVVSQSFTRDRFLACPTPYQRRFYIWPRLEHNTKGRRPCPANEDDAKVVTLISLFPMPVAFLPYMVGSASANQPCHF